MVPENRKVVAVVYDGICGFEFGVATELFGLPRPELEVPWYRYEVVSVDAGPLRAIGGVTLSAPTELSTLVDAGTIVLPGWRSPFERPPDALLDALRDAHDAGARIMSICSGVFPLAATGLLDGQQATTHWRYTDELARLHPTIDIHADVLYIDNGSTLTSAGSAAGIDLGLHLIRRDYGADIANQVARRLVVAPHRDGGQAQFIDRPVQHDETATLAIVMDWAMERLDEPLTVADLASAAAMSPRTFARRFTADFGHSPHRWLVQQRISAARQMLETTDQSIDEVARRCGFGTAATLRHHFGREVQTTPTAYRRTFRSASLA